MKKKSLNFKTLNNALKRAVDRVDDLRDEIEAVETKLALPKLKKQYVGRFFKYMNSYGGNREDDWPVYVFVKSIKSKSQAVVDTFESSPDGENKFTIAEERGFWLCQTEITAQEYDDALLDLYSKVAGMRADVFNLYA